MYKSEIIAFFAQNDHFILAKAKISYDSQRRQFQKNTLRRATIRGKTSGSLEHTVVYPPNGVIPFHGFAMFCAPFCYVYDDPVQLYLGTV